MKKDITKRLQIPHKILHPSSLPCLSCGFCMSLRFGFRIVMSTMFPRKNFFRFVFIPLFLKGVHVLSMFFKIFFSHTSVHFILDDVRVI